ncbi:MAG TPA: UdgX family uracil-DNA binding protein [Gaiellales bacterium]|nr:UdgX family uracil-DNA binding protein [Gaiellales bacterium]
MGASELNALREEAAGCRRCDLWKLGTQTVFGEGPADARVVMAGEQPGDQEDRAGRPFVGPAGRVLDEALERAGIAREQIYVTNAVKHFKWQPRGKRRIHQRPGRTEITACQPWLLAELEAIDPLLLVLLGSVAATSVHGPSFRVTKQRGQPLPGPDGVTTLATVHPSSILRGDPSDREQAMDGLVADLSLVPDLVERLAAGQPA